MTSPHLQTKDDYLSYIKSSEFDVSSRPDRAALYSGVDPEGVANWRLAEIASGSRDMHERTKTDFDKLEKTPGGEHLYGSLKENNLSVADTTEIWQEASKKYVEQASGNITCYVDGAGSDGIFRTTELPTCLSNENITSLNGVSKFELTKDFSKDPEVDRGAVSEHVFNKLEDGLRRQYSDTFDLANQRDVTRLEELTGKPHHIEETSQGVLKDKVSVGGEDFARLNSSESGDYALVKWQSGMEKFRDKEISVEKDSFSPSSQEVGKTLERTLE